MTVGAIILAAGESSRMGHPKPLLPFRGGTFLSVLSETLARRCSPVVAVLGARAELMSGESPAQLIPVTNANYELGMLSSLQTGLRALPGRDAVLFTLVDHPAIQPATVDALIAALERSGASIAIPRFGGKRGHPVIARGPVIGEFLAEPPSSKVRDVIDRHAAEIEYVEVEDAGVCDDIDDPALYLDLMSREARHA